MGLAEKQYLRDRIPPMTYKLLNGIGAADSPEDGDSFGLHRCKIIAIGILNANKHRSQQKKIRAIGESFRNFNMNIDKPYLNSDSIDVYEGSFKRSTYFDH